MTERLVWDGVVTVMRETFDDDRLEVSRETTADDVDGWDSLSNVELIVALESRFGVRFHTGEIARMRNVGELVDAIAKRLPDDGR
ncbi:MAG TPA: acyl carrier protein [Gemmatimonadaceae bacterium]|nr:acyl carrier protein [Gemmatimonadaceae bacterium]